MTQIEQKINQFVKTLKSCESMSGYRFTKEFKAVDFPNPLEENMIVVSILGTTVTERFFPSSSDQSTKCEVYSVALRFRAYAKSNDGGEGLIQLCYDLCKQADLCDTDNSISKISTSGISFDEDARTVYRDVDFVLDFCIYEEGAV